MLAQRQPDMAVVLDDVVTFRHLAQLHRRLHCSGMTSASRSAATANSGSGSSRKALMAWRQL